MDIPNIYAVTNLLGFLQPFLCRWLHPPIRLWFNYDGAIEAEIVDQADAAEEP